MIIYAVCMVEQSNHLFRKYAFEDCLNKNPDIEGFDQFNYCWNKINP